MTPKKEKVVFKIQFHDPDTKGWENCYADGAVKGIIPRGKLVRHLLKNEANEHRVEVTRV